MNDMKLIGLAAKSVGTHLSFDYRRHAHFDENGVAWNPLADDGDAFRLMVTKRLDLHIDKGRSLAVNQAGQMFAEYHDCPFSATRRAITRAVAAEAGSAGHETFIEQVQRIAGTEELSGDAIIEFARALANEWLEKPVCDTEWDRRE